jgi:uroporphyrinogen-III synthase
VHSPEADPEPAAARLAVVLTQPDPRGAAIAAAVARPGLLPVRWPLSRIVPTATLDAAGLHARLAASDWVLVPSPGAIHVVADLLAAGGLDWPARPAVGLVGPGSLEAWRSRAQALPGLRGARVVVPPGPAFDAAGLLAAPELARLDGQLVLVLRREDVEPAWAEGLRARGAQVRTLAAYRAEPIGPPAGAADWLTAVGARGEALAWSVASAEAGGRLAAFVAPLPCGDWALGRPVLAQHPRIGAALQGYGWRDVRLHDPGVEALVRALESLRSACR